MGRIKQVIVVRTDLKNKKGEKVRTGKLITQGAHAAVNCVMKTDSGLLSAWADDGSTKIVVKCNSEAELIDLKSVCMLRGVPFSLVRDAGRTEFAEPTYTALGIGPCDGDAIDKITGNLELF